jgi:hypothetical protein
MQFRKSNGVVTLRSGSSSQVSAGCERHWCRDFPGWRKTPTDKRGYDIQVGAMESLAVPPHPLQDLNGPGG